LLDGAQLLYGGFATRQGSTHGFTLLGSVVQGDLDPKHHLIAVLAYRFIPHAANTDREVRQEIPPPALVRESSRAGAIRTSNRYIA